MVLGMSLLDCRAASRLTLNCDASPRMSFRLCATVALLTAGRSLQWRRVLELIRACTPGAEQILLIWSGERPLSGAVPSDVQVRRIPPSSFDHGGSRQLALDLCTTDLLCFLSDDAEPASPDWLQELTKPFSDHTVLACYGRQLARPDAGLAETAFRMARYPARSAVFDEHVVRLRSAMGLPFSDANAAYRVSALRSMGGFPRRCEQSEDHAVALHALATGWRVAYVAEALVWHSHSLRWLELAKRGWKAGGLRLPAGMYLGPRAFVRGGGSLLVQMLRFGWEKQRVRGVGAVAAAAGARGLGFASRRVLRALGLRRG